jgi:hypothetical protein
MTRMLVLLGALFALPAQAKVGPPDPRKGERLDGRNAPADPNARALAVPRLVLYGPRLAFRAVMYPVVKSTAYLEEHAVFKKAHWAITSDDRRIGVRPSARYDSAFGAMLGASYFDRRTLGPDSLIGIRFRAGVTAPGEKMVGEFRLRGPYGIAGFHARYERNPYAVFAGIHGETRAELNALGAGRTRYAFDRGTIGLDSEHELGRTVLVRGVGDLEMAVFEPGSGRGGEGPIDEVYDPMTIPGFVDGTRLLRGGLEVELDTRREKRYGTGVTLHSGAWASRGFDGDPSRFVTMRSEARGYLGLHDRALVLRLRGGMIEPLGDAPVPFDQLLSPTGPDGMRGVAAGERRGHTELVGSLEYQWLIAPSFDAMVFVDHGGAFDEDFEGLEWSRLEPSVGVGVRHLSRSRPYWFAIPNSGVQLAWAPDHGVRFVFAVGL